jgi:hypothetical protein
LSFRDFVRSRDITRNARGDFIDDARVDANFPDPNTLEELEAYLSSCRACEAAREAGRNLWREYEAYSA